MAIATTAHEAEETSGPTRRSSRPKTFLRRPGVIGLIVAVCVLAAGLPLPALLGYGYNVTLLVSASLIATMAIGIGFLSRHLGVFSLAHTGIFGAGSYGVAISHQQWGWGPTPGVLAGVALGVLVAAIAGLLVMRAQGMIFLMLTLAIGQVCYQLVLINGLGSITGTNDGLIIGYGPDQTLLGMTAVELMNANTFWPVIWTVLVVFTFGLWVAGRSRFGSVLHGIRENEERMRFSGYGILFPKYCAFVLSGVAAAVGGALFAVNASLVTPDSLGFQSTSQSLIGVVVGGANTVLGPIIGPGIYVWTQSELGTTGNLEMFTGIALMVTLMFMRGGIVGAVAGLLARVRAASTRKGRK